jgi:hypothetical protein
MASGFGHGKGIEHDRFKLFNDAKLREVVFNRVRIQLGECGLWQLLGPKSNASWLPGNEPVALYRLLMRWRPS